MLCHRNDVACTGIFEKFRPGICIEFFRFEERDEILVAEILLLPVGFKVMLIFRRPLDIHVPRIPFIIEGRNGVKSPVNKNTELRIAEPARRLVFGERLPRIGVRPLLNSLFYLFHPY